jgi:hypothetical protein
MVSFKDWSDGWIKEGHYISFIYGNTRYYEYVLAKDFAHWEYDWPETVTALAVSGPFTPESLEITRGYDENNNTNRLWQLIFGIKGQAYIYIELPTDTHRHGIPKKPKPSTDDREVSHFEEYMSSFHQPHFITEHFMMRPVCSQITFEAYNPNAINLTDLTLNIMINKMITERIGTERNGLTTPSRPRYGELLDKLSKHLVPCRPISLMPVTAPAEAPAGE